MTLINLWPTGGMMHYASALANALARRPGLEVTLLVPEEAELKTDKPDDYAIAANPAGGLSLKGHLAEASSGGRTGGVYFDLPAGYEQKFSGRTVRIDVLASAEAGSGDFQMAYSTNDVGNSRWQPLKAPKGAFDIASFTYEVPALKNGNGDFIGILPDPDGTGNVLAIRAISLKIVN